MHKDIGEIINTGCMVLGKLPPSPNSNANHKPNPDPDWGTIFLGDNFPDTGCTCVAGYGLPKLVFLFY